MNKIYGQVFRASDGNEFGIIRPASEPFPDELLSTEVVAEDECGNYFILKAGEVFFWNHENSDLSVIANSISDFISGCVEPSEIDLRPNQVNSAWIDPDFAASLGIKLKS
ncbi:MULTISPECIES: SMI1/KNR4 family protein [Deefgea]|uniref:SMI1/KNR4 family protein n=1 Tax=Deefgea chitinilytica TaxID=570276 RepID=A0ABS2C9C9_9NEIS|nr:MULTISPECIES: SMI1/KNR4 family protein [Deefgea]MBM5570749.1 SMI1/KNR4 family protein [Deefgea chitinilytica]MBM9887978.1 SMI1/KNR4 family protein [Deefgea sp. CFH1-16]